MLELHTNRQYSASQVLVLLQELRQEVELHQVLEEALAHKNGSNSTKPAVPCDLPVDVSSWLAFTSMDESA